MGLESTFAYQDVGKLLGILLLLLCANAAQL